MRSKSLNKLSLLLLVSVFVMITSCHFNSTYNNREGDKEEGQKVIAQFYELSKAKHYPETYKLFDKQFFAVTDTQKLNEIYDIAFEKLGSVESYTIEQSQTQAVVGTDAKTEYLFECIVKRTLFPSKETIRLLKDKDEVKIISYHINSDALLKK